MEKNVLDLASQSTSFRERLRGTLETELLNNFIADKNNNELYDVLVKLLEETKSNQQLGQNLDYLEEQYKELKIKYMKMEQDFQAAEAQRQILAKSLEEHNARVKALTKGIESFEDRYNHVDEIYEIYLGLDEGVKSGLDGIFKLTDTVDQFLLCGTEYERLEMLWDFISYAIANVDGDDAINKLGEIFDYFFDLYRQMNPMYERLEVNTGTAFDGSTQTKVGRTSGRVIEVKLRGIKNVHTQKILRKSVVLL
ncbi:MAG: hypothetical protein ATN36_07850 [Epulopiscium sp. Nele67-Bin005]|nr:MAG: hypothetical protein ATN36_07850 [Epulopiscium sp. Nele67-Bin005]